MKRNELIAFIITFVIVIFAVLCLLLFLSQVSQGQVLINVDNQPLSAVGSVNEVGFYIRGIEDRQVLGLFGKYTLLREHLFSLCVLQEDFSYTVYDEHARLLRKEEVSKYSYTLGYRYQFWDIDKPFLGFALKAKYMDSFSFDVDFTVYESKTKTFFYPSISLGVEDILFIPRYFVVVSQEIRAPISVLFGLKGSIAVAEESRGWQVGFWVGASLKEFKRFSDLSFRVESDFSEAGYLRTNVGLTLGFKDVVFKKADVETTTKYRYHEYLGDNAEFVVKVVRKKHTPEVENLIKELRELEVVVSRIRDFTLGQSMVEEARALIQQGAYDQAREVVEKLRLYLKEW